MALSKLVIGLVAGIASVATIGGVTAAVVTSSNRNTVNTVEEEKTENKDLATNTSMSENRSRNQTSNTNDVNKKETDNDQSLNEKHQIQAQDDKSKSDVDVSSSQNKNPSSMNRNEEVVSTTMENSGSNGEASKDSAPMDEDKDSSRLDEGKSAEGDSMGAKESEREKEQDKEKEPVTAVSSDPQDTQPSAVQEK